MSTVSRVLSAILLMALPASAQLATDWMVPAVGHGHGARGTFWSSDVSLHNPHAFDLPVVLQLMPSERENWEAATYWVTLYPYETFNLWDVMGPDLFDVDGSAAMLVYADTELECEPLESCAFLVSSRTYTLDPQGRGGEFGQGIPATDVWDGLDWLSYGYVAGVLADGVVFRCNVGVASWTADWTTVWYDVQDADGTIVATHELRVPPFGHVQRPLPTAVEGGSLVFYLVEGPENARVFPYASMIDQDTGDPTYLAAVPSVVGASVDKREHSRGGLVRPERAASSAPAAVQSVHPRLVSGADARDAASAPVEEGTELVR